MDFFEAQARAKHRTKRLVLLFALAVAGTIAASYAAALFITGFSGNYASRHSRHRYDYDYSAPTVIATWWNPRLFAGVAAGTLAVVGLASLYKWSQFRAGGSTVAESVGARRLNPHTTDLHERRLLNIVEEMAIASGVPLPVVYVMDEEEGINAFAAGLTTSDAAVCVTRGTLQKLNRDELQGVIGHEFSHILNGDMRLNVHLTAIIFGILVLGLLGRGILQGIGRSRVRLGGGKKGGGVAVILAAGVALLVIGYVGYFFGRLIQAAVSRQREFLADASAVQFTRNPAGIGGALRKIGGYALGSALQAENSEQLGHFFFAQGFQSMFGGLWATHPPLEDRIKAIDTKWDGTFIEPPRVVDVSRESFVDAGLAPRKPAPPPLQPLAPAAAVAAIGALTPQAVDYAQQLLARVPPTLRDAARDPAGAAALVYALLLDAEIPAREKQFATLGALAGSDALQRTREFAAHASALPAAARLPLLNLTLPALRQLPEGALDQFARACDALILADGEISVFEFLVQKALIRHVVVGRAPETHAAPALFSFQTVAAEISLVLSLLASASADHLPAQQTAFAAGAAQLPLLAGKLVFQPARECDFHALDAALDRLATASGPIKQRTLLAAAHAVTADGLIQPTEAELLRAVADALGCPMPPLLASAA